MARRKPHRFQFNPVLNPGLPTEFELIKTSARLIEESLTQHHCVHCYDRDIDRGECTIYSLLKDGNRYTLELRNGYSGLYWRQIMGRFNVVADEAIQQFAQQALATCSAKKPIKRLKRPT